jgi:hypothetical protein
MSREVENDRRRRLARSSVGFGHLPAEPAAATKCASSLARSRERMPAVEERNAPFRERESDDGAEMKRTRHDDCEASLFH